MPGPTLLVVQSLTRRFGRTAALAGVDLQVVGGEVVLVAGPNGAGKSTLLRCIAGLTRPTSGTVLIGGRSLRADPGARGQTGFLSHQTLLYDDLTARENLRFAATLQGLDDVERRLTDALDAAGLTPQSDLRAAALSHGMRQRLATARATLHAPELLLLDEPFSGLDAAATTRLRDRITIDASRGRAVLCVTHHPAEIWEQATRIVMLSRGAVVLDVARPEDLDAFVRRHRELLVA